jgi:hypothetical protein
MKKNKDKFNPSDLPADTFTKKEIYQHPQPANQGKPLNKNKQKKTGKGDMEADKTSKLEGINEVNSKGNAGSFEGFEDQLR